MEEKSVDFIGLCLRAISAWQYMDPKLKSAKLTCIEKNCPYPRASSMSIPLNVSEDITKDLVCTKYTLEKDLFSEISLSDKRENNRDAISTAKTFFNQSDAEIPFKQKQSIYWLIRLRYACGIIPIAILKMIPDLKNLGYNSFKLPDGNVVPFSSVWLGDLVVVPKQYHIVETSIAIGNKHMDVITEAVEYLSGNSKNGPFVNHSVIVLKVNSEDKSLHIVDPTSLQFCLQGQNSDLIMYANYNEYVEKFPGTVLEALIEKDESEERLEQKWKIGNMGFDHCKRLIQAILKDFAKPACNHCGEVELGHKGSIQLLNCSRCMKVKYCDKLCQKISWKSHSASCSPNPLSTGTETP